MSRETPNSQVSVVLFQTALLMRLGTTIVDAFRATADAAVGPQVKSLLSEGIRGWEMGNLISAFCAHPILEADKVLAEQVLSVSMLTTMYEHGLRDLALALALKHSLTQRSPQTVDHAFASYLLGIYAPAGNTALQDLLRTWSTDDAWRTLTSSSEPDSTAPESWLASFSTNDLTDPVAVPSVIGPLITAALQSGQGDSFFKCIIDYGSLCSALKQRG